MQCRECGGEVVEVSIVKMHTGKRSAKVCTKCGMIYSQYKMFREVN